MIFYGAGGHAKVVIETWMASGGKVTAIYDDDESIKILLGKSVGGRYNPGAFPDTTLVIAIGNNTTRKQVAHAIQNKFGIVKHPAAIISPSVKINEGTVVMAGTVIQAETTIGKHAIINTSASIDHDCVVGDFVHVAPGAVLCGDVTVGEGTLIGAGATVLPGISIGQWAVVGAGSVVTTNVPDSTVVAGNPSRVRSGDHRDLGRSMNTGT
jgi:sugar O-acyltransferase (sialic acid O-acetyltransferase NeuD family)